MKQGLKVRVVIPVYNEETGIPALFERLRGVTASNTDVSFEFILVDDHSSDATPELMKRACADAPEYTYLRLSSNCGSHVAILAGLEHARGDCAAFLAADLQDPPELIPRLIESWREGNHVIWAVRAEREGIHWIERVFAETYYWLLRRVGMVKMPPRGSDFALLDRKVIDALLASVGANPSLGGDIARLGFRETHIPYVKKARMHGKSKWTIERKLRAFADAFVSFSYVPLRFMSYLGMACSVLGFLYAAFIIIMRLAAAQPIAGWASIMMAVLVLGGVQMTMLGVLGEYLWRTLEAARRRPRYFIEDSLHLDQDCPPQRTEQQAGNVGVGAPAPTRREDREAVN
ncbi:MAG: glycosyltransferase family 2 protein [Planctomycetes bacterium]|nr:glycosyltransferase family 2 protein [Planctomycetota bacterium]